MGTITLYFPLSTSRLYQVTKCNDPALFFTLPPTPRGVRQKPLQSKESISLLFVCCTKALIVAYNMLIISFIALVSGGH